MSNTPRPIDRPSDGCMWIGVLPTGQIKPVPQIAKALKPFATGREWLDHSFQNDHRGRIVEIPSQNINYQADTFDGDRVISGKETHSAPPTAPATLKGRAITVHDRQYILSDGDAIPLFGALALAVDGQTARVTLASGETLELTHEDVSDLGRQLAGKPADAVSGQDQRA